MRTHWSAAPALASLALAACGGGRSVEIDPQQQFVGSRWNATLATPAALVGASQVRGTGWMGPAERDSATTRAEVSISNAVPGGSHPWHVHRGQCGNDQGIFGEAQAYPLLQVGGNGTAQASATVALPVPTSGQFYISVHASPENLGTVVACGNLAPPIR